MSDHHYPDAPWADPSGRPRVPCVACGDSGVASNGKPCVPCEGQRAIDAAARAAGVDAKRLSDAAATKTAAAAARMPTSAEVMADYAPMVAKLNEHYPAPSSVGQKPVASGWADAWSGPTTRAQIITDCSSSLYHSDPHGPSLSASMARTMLDKSAYHGWLAHPKKGALRSDATKPMSGGTLLHALVLGKGVDDIVIVDGFANWKKKAAQEQQDAALEAGKTPILRHEYEDAVLVAKDARESMEDLGYPLTGISEAVVTWYEPSEYGPVKCRAMIDHLQLGRCAVWDFKTTRSAHPRAIASHIMDYGYDIQESAYRSALRKLVADSAGRESFTFLFCETMPPGSPRRALITPCRLNGTFRAIGENRWRRAIELWAKCSQQDLWPAYTESCIDIEPPTWALRNEVAEGVMIEPAA